MQTSPGLRGSSNEATCAGAIVVGARASTQKIDYLIDDLPTQSTYSPQSTAQPQAKYLVATLPTSGNLTTSGNAYPSAQVFRSRETDP